MTLGQPARAGSAGIWSEMVGRVRQGGPAGFAGCAAGVVVWWVAVPVVVWWVVVWASASGPVRARVVRRREERCMSCLVYARQGVPPPVFRQSPESREVRSGLRVWTPGEGGGAVGSGRGVSYCR